MKKGCILAVLAAIFLILTSAVFAANGPAKDEQAGIAGICSFIGWDLTSIWPGACRVFLGFILLLTTTISAWSATLRVPSGHSTIQSAINNANNGDTVLVDPGYYAEQIDFISKQITVQGVPGATISAPNHELLSEYGVSIPDDIWLTLTETGAASDESVTFKIQFDDTDAGGGAEDMISFTLLATRNSATNYTLQQVIDAVNEQSQNLGNDPYGNSKNYAMASAHYDINYNKYYLKLGSRLATADDGTMTISTGCNTNTTGAFVGAKDWTDYDVTEDDGWVGDGGSRKMEHMAGTSGANVDTALIDAGGGTGVSFNSGEGPGSVLKNVIIQNADTAISITDSSPTIKNVTVVNNLNGIEAAGSSSPDISDCILWNNAGDDLAGCQTRYSCIEDGDTGLGNISDGPCFVHNINNFHLKSRARRWDMENKIWVVDDVTSPCIDAGDTTSPVGWLEPFPNAGVVNMGAYGGTDKASGSYFGGLDCSTIVAGDINGDCMVDLQDFALMANNWLVDNNP